MEMPFMSFLKNNFMKKVILLSLMFFIYIYCKAQTIHYTYDNLGRLTRAAYPDSSIISYKYDASGNRTSTRVKDDFYHSPQTITFGPLADVVYGTADIDPGSTSTNATIPIVYSSSNTAIATITSAGKIHVIAVGTVNITANQAGNNAYLAALPASRSLLITPAPLKIRANDQTRVYKAANPLFTVNYVTFVNGDDQTKLTTQPVVTTTAVSNSAVGVYPLTVAGAADPNYVISYSPGTLTITRATRTFTFSPLIAKIFIDTDFDLAANIDSGEPITYSSSDLSVATVVNNKVHITGAGTTIITAAIAANANYKDTAPLSQTLTVNKAPQTITFAPIPVQAKGGTDLVLQVTSSSGLPVVLTSSDPSVAVVSGSTVKFLTLGTTIITATQAGNANFLPATVVSQPLKIDNADGSLVLIHRIISPNGDGVNDVLEIEGIKDYPSNQLTVVDRNGIKVYAAKNYNNKTVVFDGHSSVTGSMVPQGTYFFKLDYTVNGQTRQKTDYFVVKL